MTRTIAILVGREPERRYSLHRGYVDAIWAVGAMPVVVAPPPAGAPAARLVEFIERCDGLLLTGGGDVDPARYGDSPGAHLMGVDGARDTAELAAVRAMVAAGRPVLGICRGIQLLAVADGGTLHQDLAAAGFAGHHWHEDRQHEPVHDVHAEPGTATASVLGSTRTVNSIHHQAVKDTGRRLDATAWSDDGVIEAVEGERLLGLQWHPERLCDRDPRHLAAFEWLVRTAA